MGLDLRHRMIGEVLADLGDDPLFHIVMESPPQIGERARRCRNDEGGDRPVAHHMLQRCGDALDKTMLLKLMPIGLADAGAARGVAARRSRARLVGALLVGRGIVVGENLFGLQIGKFLVAVVAQEQRLAPVADKNQTIVRNCDLVHISLLSSPARFTASGQC
jgi:hypothetical protein